MNSEIKQVGILDSPLDLTGIARLKKSSKNQKQRSSVSSADTEPCGAVSQVTGNNLLFQLQDSPGGRGAGGRAGGPSGAV